MITAYREPDRAHGKKLVQSVVDSLSAGVPAALTKLKTLGRTLKRRAADVLACFDRPGTSNGPTESINGVWGFTCSIDGYIAGPNYDMSWISTAEPLVEGTKERMADDVAVIISGRAGYDAAKAQQDERDETTSAAYGGAWSGTEFILTHRPEEIAGDPDVQIISADIARQALERDLIDELQVFVAPVFLGDGTRIFDVPGGRRIDWELVDIYEDSPRSFGRTYRPRQR